MLMNENDVNSKVYNYLGTDTRCLKPDSDKDPSKWEHYVPEDFINATSQVIMLPR